MIVRRSTALVLLALLFTVACDDDGGILTVVPDVPSEGGIFLDDFAQNVTFQPFDGSKSDALEIDPSVTYRGGASLKVTVPGPGEGASYSGGSFTSSAPWNLSQYDVLSFWARSDRNATIDVAGLGNNLAASPFMVEATSMDVTGVWRKYIIPLPNPSSLSSLDGLFHFAEGQENGDGYTIWFDDIRFESLGATVVRASMTNGSLVGNVGSTTKVEGLMVTLNAGGPDISVSTTPAYFTFVSSDESVATVTSDGTITIVGEGTASITASIGSADVSGSVVVTTGKGLTDPAPTLPHDPSNVISLFSNQYTNSPVDTWSAGWDMADLEDTQVAGDDLKKYTNLVFAGIEFTSQTVDATGMTHFHMDIWTPDDVDAGQGFKIKLVDFGANGVWDGGGDDVEHELAFTASTMPALAKKEWVSLDIPLADFTNMTTRGAVAQLIISGDLSTVNVDNVLFYNDVFNPTGAAPTPTHAASDVISLFSNAYTDVTVDTWSADWDDADVADVQVAGDDVKKYTNLSFAGIEFTSAPVDASSMTHFRFDYWSPDGAGAGFKVKLVDFGANGVWDGGGDDVEHEITLDAASTPPLATAGWVSFDIALTDFTNLTTTGSLAQLIISGSPNTVFLDNIYLRK